MGESALWNAVLLQAIQDITTTAKTGEMAVAKADALRFLSKPSADLLQICDMANLHYEKVLKAAKIAQERGFVIKPKPDKNSASYLKRRAKRQRRKAKQ